MNSESLRSTALVVGTVGTALLTLVSAISPAQAATTSYNITIDTTEHMWGGPIRFTFIAGSEPHDPTTTVRGPWMGQRQRTSFGLQYDADREQVWLIARGEGLSYRKRIDPQGKRYVRIGGYIGNPMVCGWKSFASRDAGNMGVNLAGPELPCTW